MELSCCCCILLALLACTIIYFLFSTIVDSNNKWKQFSIPYLPNRLPIFGHVLSAVLGRRSLPAMCEELYRTKAPASVCGFYYMTKPALLIRDPDLVKTIFQTEFGKFARNGIIIDPKLDPVFHKNPFFNTGDLWRMSRNRIINNFSGKKLTQLSTIVSHVCEKLRLFTDQKIQNSQDGSVEFELKEYFSRCTGEVVANAAFGMDGQSFEDDPDEKSFTELAKVFFDAPIADRLQQVVRFFLPELANCLGISLMPRKVDQQFRRALRDIIDQRRASEIMHQDYLQFILELDGNNWESGSYDEDLVIAEAMSFYTDVYETTSITLSFLFYRLANNPEVQDKLRQEIKAVLAESGGKLTYESTKKMVYLEQAMMESLRMNPSLNLYMKICTERTRLQGRDGLECEVEPGDLMFVSATALHNDPEFWKDPGIYDPERFDSNSKLKEKFAFLPFGEGPRMCVGRRMAMMLAKLATATVVSNYLIEPSLTRNEFKIDQSSAIVILTYTENGLWARFKKL